MNSAMALDGLVDTVHAPLGDRSYEILIGRGLLSEAGAALRDLTRRPRVVVAADATVAALHWRTLEAGLAAGGLSATLIELPPGEGTKSFPQLEALLDRLLDAKVERDDLIIAFGGGVIGDLVGFAAAVLRRGVRFAQIPTTLLAQVDSSVGGKTGINARHGKNLIGAFHQPSRVLIDVAVLETLPDRELKAGYAEVVKYGLLGDRDFFEWLEARGGSVLGGDVEDRIRAVQTSCAAKAAIVARDETEAGDRALLNLGHTFAHALEAATGYSDRLLHGEAVSIGMRLAFEASARLGLCPGQEVGRVTAHLDALGLKARLTDIPGELPDAAGLMALMAQDKKVKDGRLTFILAREIGAAFRTQDADRDVIQTLLAQELSARG